MEVLRSITIAVEVDTNKATYTQRFNLDDYDNLDDQLAAFVEWLDAHADGAVGKYLPDDG